MTFPDERLMAYVDRELDAASAAEIEAAAARDPQLAKRIERHQALRSALGAAYDPVLDEPLPDRLRDLAAGTGAPAALAASRRRSTWLAWGGAAASLALGIGIGATLLRERPSGGDVIVEQGRLVASGSLAAALSRQLAASQPADAPVRIGLTFVSRDGKYCRTFTRLQHAQAGLACHDSGTWRLEVVAEQPAAAAEYRTAGASAPQAVLRAVEERMQGATLDAAAERAARDRGWAR